MTDTTELRRRLRELIDDCACAFSSELIGWRHGGSYFTPENLEDLYARTVAARDALDAEDAARPNVNGWLPWPPTEADKDHARRYANGCILVTDGKGTMSGNIYSDGVRGPEDASWYMPVDEITGWQHHPRPFTRPSASTESELPHSPTKLNPTP